MARGHVIRKLLRLRMVRDCCLGFLVAGVILLVVFERLLDVQPAKVQSSIKDAVPAGVQRPASANSQSVPGISSGSAVVPAAAAAPAISSAQAARGAVAVVKDASAAQGSSHAGSAHPMSGVRTSVLQKRFAGASSIDSRVYFPDMLVELGLSGAQGIEVGAAKGRFSDFLLHRWRPKHWVLIDPVKLPQLEQNLDAWKQDPLLKSSKIEFLQGLSTDEEVLSKMPHNEFDFIYIDAAHDYKNVKKELPQYWKRLRSGGLMAGHDYCGTKKSVAKLSKALVKGRPNIRPCGPYTDYAAKNPTASGKLRKEGGEARDQIGVVQALLEWINEEHPELELRFTSENFTRETLARDNINYDDIITSTRNPSWYFFKPSGDPEKPLLRP